MTDFSVEIVKQPDYLIDAVSSGNSVIVEITNRDKILPSDFPDTYPISSTVGLLPASRVSGLIGSSGISVSSGINNTLVISLTGIPQSLLNTWNFSGLYVNNIPVSTSGHSHSTLDIANFNNEVSGLIPVKSISGGYGVGVVNNSGYHTIYSTLNTINESYSLVTNVFNRTQNTIPKFTVVYISGGQGDLPIISPAIASAESTSSKTFGVTQEAIAPMSSGHIVSYGNISGLNTDLYNPSAPQGDINGQVLYLSPTISGGLTANKPYAPNHLVAIGTVIRTHQNEGIFNVRIQNGFEIEELHNVSTTGSLNGQFLRYDSSLRLWKNSGIVSADIPDLISTISGVSPNITISGTSGISVDKTGNNYLVYTTGNFGLTSSQIQQLLNNGVSISVTGGSGNYNYLYVNNTGVSLNGHTHLISDITNFSSGVSGLLTPYALLSSGNFSNLFVTGIPVSLSGHKHSSIDIADFNTTVNNLINITGVSGSGDVIASLANKNVTISVTGLQPSGNYSLVGHSHTTNDITNFNTSVSGLISGIYAPLNSPAFSGIPTVPTANSGTNSNQIASTSFVRTEISNLISSAPSTLDTLNELAAALGNDPNFATTITNTLSTKIAGTGTNNYIPKFSGSQVLANSLIYDNGSSIGIGTNAPTSRLHVLGDITSSGGYFSSLYVNSTGVSLSGHNHTVSDITNFNSGVSGLLSSYSLLSSGNFTTLYVTGIPVSTSGHKHLSTDITDFNTATSGLIPITGVVGIGYAVVSTVNKNTSISITGLQPSGNYSLVGHQHLSSDITNFNNSVSGLLTPYALLNSGNFTSLYVTGIPVSLSGHTHTSSQITDFNTSVNNLVTVKAVSGSGYVSVISNTGNYIVSVNGLQPSGNYSLVGHTHVVNDITDFSAGVSGLLTPYALLNSGNFTKLYVTGIPVSLSGHKHLSSDITDFAQTTSGLLPITNIIGTSGASVTSSGSIFTVSVTGNFGLSSSGVQSYLNSGVNIWITGGSGNFSSLTVNSTGVSLIGHTHITSDIVNFDSSVSGLLPVTNVTGVSGINVVFSGTTALVSSISTGGGVSVSNSGLNRVLLSDGTTSGIIAQSGLTFDGKSIFVNGVNTKNGQNLYMWANFR